MVMVVKVALVAVVLVVMGMLGWLWLKASTESYDQRYSNCMSTKQSQLYPANHYFPDDAYNEAMRDCEKQAGVPTTPERKQDNGIDATTGSRSQHFRAGSAASHKLSFAREPMQHAGLRHCALLA